MFQMIPAILVLFSVLVPSKQWYAPNKPIEINIKADQPVRLVMVDFSGKVYEPTGSNEVTVPKTVDILSMYPQLSKVNAYVLLAVPKDKPSKEFLGTPLVVQVLAMPRPAAPTVATAIRVQPLVYATMATDMGNMKMLFWYDVAPNTVTSFVGLASGGYFDGLTFHRVMPDFVIQGGDPIGTGTGGPGYNLPAEFNDRPHDLGVLSMARQGDPLEQQGLSPRTEFANSAGSQFFICLSRESTKQLDKLYSGYGQVFEGIDVVKAIGKQPLQDAKTGRPEKPTVIQSVRIMPVSAPDNPYINLLKLDPTQSDPVTQPTVK